MKKKINKYFIFRKRYIMGTCTISCSAKGNHPEDARLKYICSENMLVQKTQSNEVPKLTFIKPPPIPKVDGYHDPIQYSHLKQSHLKQKPYVTITKRPLSLSPLQTKMEVTEEESNSPISMIKPIQRRKDITDVIALEREKLAKERRDFEKEKKEHAIKEVFKKEYLNSIVQPARI